MELNSYSVSNEHIEYTKRKTLWQKIEDCVAGEDQVKSKAELYLPRPSGMDAKTAEGKAAYESYIGRAHFPDITSKFLSALTGITKINPPKFSLPKELEYLKENCDGEGTPLDIYFYQSVTEALKSGRQIVYPDVDVKNNRLKFVRYNAKDIINWGVVGKVFNNKDADFYVIREYIQDSTDIFAHDYSEQYRVFTKSSVLASEETNTDVFMSIIFDESENIVDKRVPMLYGKPFEGFPITVIGSTDLNINPDTIPLLGVASCALQMYMKDADLSNSMFLTCNPTLCMTGFQSDNNSNFNVLVGSNIAIIADDPQARVYYTKTDASGLQEVRLSIQMYLAEAQSMGSALLSNVQKGVESEGALKMKAASTTASLSTVSQTVARGFESTIRYMADWMSVESDEVIVKVDNNYLDNMITTSDIQSIIDLYISDVITHETALLKLKEGDFLNEDFNVSKELSQVKIKKQEKESENKINSENQGNTFNDQMNNSLIQKINKVDAKD